MTTFNQTLKLSVVAMSLALAACSSDSNNKTPETTTPTPAPTPAPTPTPAPAPTPTPTPAPAPAPTPAPEAEQGEIFGPYSTGSISESKFVYFDLDEAKVVELTEEQAATDTVWDVAFKRTSVFLNANNADSPVSVYDTGNNSDFWDAEGNAVVDSFVNATADSEKQEYLDVTATDIPSDSTMFKNDVTDRILDDFYVYDMTTHTVSAAAENFYVVKNNDVYSKFSVTNLVQNVRVASEMTVSVSYDFGDTKDILVSAASECTAGATHAYVSFMSGTTVAADEAYDITIPCQQEAGLGFELNLADTATAYQDFKNEIADADTASTYASYGYFKQNEYTTTAFGELNWYAYGIQGNHKLWSKYGVYIIKSGDKHFKFQITSYYNEEGTSGNYSFRANEIAAQQ